MHVLGGLDAGPSLECTAKANAASANNNPVSRLESACLVPVTHRGLSSSLPSHLPADLVLLPPPRSLLLLVHGSTRSSFLYEPSFVRSAPRCLAHSSSAWLRSLGPLHHLFSVHDLRFASTNIPRGPSATVCPLLPGFIYKVYSRRLAPYDVPVIISKSATTIPSPLKRQSNPSAAFPYNNSYNSILV